MSEHIQTILAVTFLTAAIWVWADLEQTDETEEQVPVKVAVPGDYSVQSISPSMVYVHFKGPRSEVQRLKNALADEIACRLEVPEQDAKPGPVTLHAREGFQHWPPRITIIAVRGQGDGVTGGDVTVRLDRVIRVRVPVIARITGAEAGLVTVQPDKVEARVAVSEFAALPEAKRHAIALLPVLSIPANLKAEADVSLEPKLGGPDGIDASFEPSIVKVTAQLKSKPGAKQLGPFKIQVTAPPRVVNLYNIVFQPDTNLSVLLDVEGPEADLERLKPTDNGITVQLVLTDDDKPEATTWNPREPVVMGLPPGIKLTKSLKPINFNLVEKSGGKPPG
jgi:hypothetical protein